MGKDKNQMDDKSIIKAAEDFFGRAEDFEKSYRLTCHEAIRFVRNNEQWTDAARRAREVPGQERIMLTFNRLRDYGRQVINNIRQNTPSIKVRPIGEGSDEETAEIFDGLIRQIQRHSKADSAYEDAASWAVDGGFGYLKVMPEFVSDSSFERIPVISAISDPFRVRYDPKSVEWDGSDAEEAIIVSTIDRKEFDRLYPGQEGDDLDWGEGAQGEGDKFYGEETVYLAEYFRIEYDDDVLIDHGGGLVMYQSDMDEEAIMQMPPPIRTRKVKRRCAYWYKIGGRKVFDKEKLGIPYIPVIPVYGDMWVFDGRRHVQGLTQNAMDAQRAYNYARTTEVELISLARRLPRVAAAQSISGFENQWATANTVNHAYLPYNAYDDSGNPLPPPGREEFPQIPSAFVNLAQEALEDLKGTSGIPDPGRGVSEGSNQSGKAIQSLQMQAAQGTSNYSQNLARSVEHIGRILIAWIPLLYDTQEVLTILGEDDTQQLVKLNRQQQNASQDYQMANGAIEKAFRLDVGEYSVAAVVGPNYVSRKQEATDSLMQLAQGMPQVMQVAAPKIIRYMDIPGADDIANAVERGIPPQLRDPKDTENENAMIMANPAVQQMQQQLQQANQLIPQLQQKLHELEEQARSKAGDIKVKEAELALKSREIDLKELEVRARIETTGYQPVEDQELAKMKRDREKLAILSEINALSSQMEGPPGPPPGMPAMPTQQSGMAMPEESPQEEASEPIPESQEKEIE